MAEEQNEKVNEPYLICRKCIHLTKFVVKDEERLICLLKGKRIMEQPEYCEQLEYQKQFKK